MYICFFLVVSSIFTDDCDDDGGDDDDITTTTFICNFSPFTYLLSSEFYSVGAWNWS